jgi:hypothetical protein
MTPSEAAVYLCRRGLRIFRLVRGTKKHFLQKDWVSSASSSLLDVDFSGDYNIGVLADDHIILDIDAQKGGLESLQSFAEHLPETFTVRTPNGGLHLYYRAPNGEQFSGSVEVIAKGIDVRAHHNYVVGPGSIFNDRFYTIENEAEIAAAPAWLCERVRPAKTKSADAAKIVGELDTSAAISSVTAYLEYSAPEAIEGQGGDNATYKVACAVLDRGVSPETALELMLEHWNERCSPPWEPEDLRKKIENAAEHRQSAIGRDNPAAGFCVVELPASVSDPFGSRVWRYDDTEESVSAIPLRSWIVPGQLIRENVTVLAAPGATAKSTWALQMGIAVTTGDGRLIGADVAEKTEVLIINNEDPLDEMRRRLAAACKHYGVPFEAIRHKIHLFSGHGNKFKLARRGNHKAQIVEGELKPFLIKYVLQHKIGVIGFDPLVSVHESNENDNTEMQRVMDILVSVVAETKAAGLAIHHTSKPDKAASDGYAGNVNAVRGASAIKDASRITLTAFGMSSKDGERYGVAEAIRHRYVRFDGAKENLTLNGPEPRWFIKRTVHVGAGQGEAMCALEPVALHAVQADKASQSEVMKLPDGRPESWPASTH